MTSQVFPDNLSNWIEAFITAERDKLKVEANGLRRTLGTAQEDFRKYRLMLANSFNNF